MAVVLVVTISHDFGRQFPQGMVPKNVCLWALCKIARPQPFKKRGGSRGKIVVQNLARPWWPKMWLASHDKNWDAPIFLRHLLGMPYKFTRLLNSHCFSSCFSVCSRDSNVCRWGDDYHPYNYGHIIALLNKLQKMYVQGLENINHNKRSTYKSLLQCSELAQSIKGRKGPVILSSNSFMISLQSLGVLWFLPD